MELNTNVSTGTNGGGVGRGHGKRQPISVGRIVQGMPIPTRRTAVVNKYKQETEKLLSTLRLLRDMNGPAALERVVCSPARLKKLVTEVFGEAPYTIKKFGDYHVVWNHKATPDPAPQQQEVDTDPGY